MNDTPGLADGVYDGFIVDAETSADGTMHLDVVITAGEHKGFVIAVVAAGTFGDEFGLIGVPATLTVAGGSPSVVVDD